MRIRFERVRRAVGTAVVCAKETAGVDALYLPTALNPLRAVLIGPGAGEKTGEAGFPNRSMPVAQ
jgi:hypothetical protein